MTSRRVFAQALLRALESATEANVEMLSNEVMRAFIIFASETPDNLNCYQNIEYGLCKEDIYNKIYGLKLKGKPIALSKVLHSLEDESIQQHIRNSREIFSDLSSEEIRAALRMATMLLIAFERHILHNRNSIEQTLQLNLWRLEMTEEGVDL